MATTGIYTYVHTLSLLDARPILIELVGQPVVAATQIIAGNSTDVEAACSLEYPSMLDLIEALLSPGCVANVSMLSVDEGGGRGCVLFDATGTVAVRSEEHTSELQSLMRISYAVFCLKKTR